MPNPFTPESSAALPGPEWLRQRRDTVLAGLDDVERPDADEEVWRYSRIGELDLSAFAPTAGPPAARPPAVPDLTAGAVAVATVSDGWITSVEVDAGAPDGLFVGPVGELPDGDELHGATLEEPVDLFGHLNRAYGPEPLAIVVPDGLRVEGHVVVHLHVSGEGIAAFPRLLVRCGADAGVTVLEVQTSEDVEALVAPVLEATVGPAGRLRHAVVQELGPRVWQLGHQEVHVHQDAGVELFAAGLGGDYARTRTDCRLLGRGAEGRITAAYFGDREQALDYRTFQEHAAPDTSSELLFKGALDGSARSVYTGLIRVRPEAVRTRADQTNRNIKLSPDAWAESVPNLEIETDDVMCSHASTVSPVDEDQRFYLESRGVPTVVAERLLLEGFFDEVLEAAPLPALADRLAAGLRTKLDRHDTLAGSAA